MVLIPAIEPTESETDCPVIAPEAEEPVLLGSAILAAVAAGLVPDMTAGMQQMSRAGET